MARPKLNRCQLDKQAENKVIEAYCQVRYWDTAVSCKYYIEKGKNNDDCKYAARWMSYCRCPEAQAEAAKTLIKQLREKYLS